MYLLFPCLGRDIGERSDEVDSSQKPLIRVSRDHHVSRESARVDTDQQRRQRFRTTNLYGHSSDSSAQRLLYGEANYSDRCVVLIKSVKILCKFF